MRRRFGVVTLLASKTADRKFVKGYCPMLVFSLQYDFGKQEFWKHNFPMAEDILDRRMVKRGNEAVCQVLIKWTGIDVVQGYKLLGISCLKCNMFLSFPFLRSRMFFTEGY